ncbi:MAG: hypothetical protein AAGF28_06190 [Pseudomonadota bacterium]
MTSSEAPNSEALKTLTDQELDGAIIAAHEAGGRASDLVELYREAASRKLSAGDNEAAGFLMTQAYVFALECHHPQRDILRDWLVARGREA